MEGSITFTVNDRAAAYGRISAEHRRARQRRANRGPTPPSQRAKVQHGPTLERSADGSEVRMSLGGKRRRTGVTLYRGVDDKGRPFLHTGDNVAVELPRETLPASSYTRPEDRERAEQRRLTIALQLACYLYPLEGRGGLNLRPTEERIAAAKHAEAPAIPWFGRDRDRAGHRAHQRAKRTHGWA